jgi:flagellar biosynthesis/type III secretory pathway protein FliH
MDAVIARYLPEFAPAAVPALVPARPQVQPQVQSQVQPQVQRQARPPATDAFGDPWAGLARASRGTAADPAGPVPAAALPPAASADAIRIESLRAGSPTEALRTAPRRETPEERAAQIAEAEERGRQQGLAEARAEAESARAQAAEAAETRLAEARRHWSAAEAEALADGFSAALRALDATLSDRSARLLAPVLTDALRRQAVAELSGTLVRLLAEPQAATVRVSGPEDLLAALAARLGPLGAAVSFTPAETAEVQVSADQTVIDTQLGAWTRLIAAAVAET